MTGPQIAILIYFAIRLVLTVSGATKALGDKRFTSGEAAGHIFVMMGMFVFEACVLHWGGFW